jgi:hypothetical protein
MRVGSEAIKQWRAGEVKGGERKFEIRESKLEIRSEVAGETVCGTGAKLVP